VTEFPAHLPAHLSRRQAVECIWLRRTIDSSRPNDPFVTICTHIVRDGRDCIGPFRDGMETDCKPWEPNRQLAERLRVAVDERPD